MEDKLKLLIALLAAGVWLGLALQGFAPMEPFIEFIKGVLVAVGAYKLTLTRPDKE